MKYTRFSRWLIVCGLLVLSVAYYCQQQVNVRQEKKLSADQRDREGLAVRAIMLKQENVALHARLEAAEAENAALKARLAQPHTPKGKE